MKGSTIALLTDFGTRDPYVAAMKGAIYSEHPGAVITDVSHGIPRHNIESAAYHLIAVAPHFPRSTIFVCVVDPSVGSQRRIILLKMHGQVFIAPDNGMLNYLCSRKEPGKAYALRYRDDAKGVSRTFHGRDLFAPAAARLAGGRSISSLGIPVPSLVPRKLFVDVPPRSKGPVRGKILHVDNFGNIITNLKISGSGPLRGTISLGRKKIREHSETYAAGPARTPFMIVGSTGLLEISVKNGDAAVTLGIEVGDRAELQTPMRP
jgi:S-adenosylmethionine hydrolase